jgi:hypothetical protein
MTTVTAQVTLQPKPLRLVPDKATPFLVCLEAGRCLHLARTRPRGLRAAALPGSSDVDFLGDLKVAYGAFEPMDCWP